METEQFEKRRRILEAKPSKGDRGPKVKVGDFVLMRRDAKHASTRSGSKLDVLWIGPFRVTRIDRGGLEISATHITSDVTVTRHARDFKPYYARNGDDVPDDNEFAIRAILGARGPAYNREYLIAWEGFADAESSWEPLDEVNAPELVAEADRMWPPAEVDLENPYVSSRRPITTSSIEDPSQYITGNFEILHTWNLRAGKVYKIKREGSSDEETVLERFIPLHQRVE